MGEISGLHPPFAHMSIGMVVKFDDGLVTSVAIHLTMTPCTDDGIAKNVALCIVVDVNDLVLVFDRNTRKFRCHIRTFFHVYTVGVPLCSQGAVGGRQAVVDDVGVLALYDVCPGGAPHRHHLTDVFCGEHGTVAFGAGVTGVAGGGADFF